MPQAAAAGLWMTRELPWTRILAQHRYSIRRLDSRDRMTMKVATQHLRQCGQTEQSQPKAPQLSSHEGTALPRLHLLIWTAAANHAQENLRPWCSKNSPHMNFKELPPVKRPGRTLDPRHFRLLKTPSKHPLPQKKTPLQL
mmetsp:Transcript_39706/g.112652  ORF Transcript_39706/g.112652 Transcript_39706/m.112652 type:complete len:141 (+) Transcript_39706:5063-5485(+)